MVQRELTGLSSAGAQQKSGKKKKKRPPPPPSVIEEEFDYPEEPDGAPGAAEVAEEKSPSMTQKINDYIAEMDPGSKMLFIMFSNTLALILLTLFGGLVFDALERETALGLNVQYIQFMQVLEEQLMMVPGGNATYAALLGSYMQDPTQLPDYWSPDGRSLYLFSFTILSTIGYGSFAPKTSGGQIFTILFALFSIPVGGVCLGKVAGTLLELLEWAAYCLSPRINRAYKAANKARNGVLDYEDMRLAIQEAQKHELDAADFTTARKPPIRAQNRLLPREPPPRPASPDRQSPARPPSFFTDNLLRCLRWPENNPLSQACKDIDPKELHLISLPKFVKLYLNVDADDMQEARGNDKAKVCSILVIGWLILGMMYFSKAESWTFVEAFYFCIVTLTTIGFGDYVPATPHGETFHFLYCVLGLGLVATLLSALSALAAAAGEGGGGGDEAPAEEGAAADAEAGADGDGGSGGEAGRPPSRQNSRTGIAPMRIMAENSSSSQYNARYGRSAAQVAGSQAGGSRKGDNPPPATDGPFGGNLFGIPAFQLPWLGPPQEAPPEEPPPPAPASERSRRQKR